MNISAFQHWLEADIWFIGASVFLKESLLLPVGKYFYISNLRCLLLIVLEFLKFDVQIWRVSRQQQQQYRGGGHGWDRAMQTQQSAYQQNWNRGGGSGPGSYQQQQQQQHYDRRRDDWHDRGANRGQHHQVNATFPRTPICLRQVEGRAKTSIFTWFWLVFIW